MAVTDGHNWTIFYSHDSRIIIISPSAADRHILTVLLDPVAAHLSSRLKTIFDNFKFYRFRFIFCGHLLHNFYAVLEKSRTSAWHGVSKCRSYFRTKSFINEPRRRSARLPACVMRTYNHHSFPAQILDQITADDKTERNAFALFMHAHNTMQPKTPTTSWLLSCIDCLSRSKKNEMCKTKNSTAGGRRRRRRRRQRRGSRSSLFITVATCWDVWCTYAHRCHGGITVILLPPIISPLHRSIEIKKIRRKC